MQKSFTSSFEKVAITLAVLAAMVVGTSQSWAHETDQFTVPENVLADIGPEVTSEMARRIQSEMKVLNKDLDKNPPIENDPRLQAPLVAKRIATHFGTNPFQTEFESWITKHEFKAQPALWQVDYPQSVFNGTALTRPLLVIALSPTLNINGNNIGLDKMGHFVQQGHEYYEIYNAKISNPDTKRIEALEAAIKHGIDQENGIYGSFTIGVYSNADMAANYAGLHFYINLTQPVSLAGKIYPPILEIHNNRWRFAGGKYPKDMLTRFITPHLNEAFNPPSLASDIYGTYAKNVRELAPAWIKFYKSTKEIEEARNLTLSRWYGEPYGYAGPEHCATICDVYFNDLEMKKSVKTAKATSTDSIKSDASDKNSDAKILTVKADDHSPGM